jgi:ligand-binding sensor domain-containing protein
MAQTQLDSWTTENGLPQNSILDILQTRDGYLWVATEGGLARFDGVRFTIFDRSTPGIQTQRMVALYEDRHGTLWAASSEGLLIRYREGRFETFRSPGEQNAGAVRIEEAEDGVLWITGVGRLGRFDGERLTYTGPEILADPVAAPPDLRYLYMDTWWRLASDGLYVFVNGRVQIHPLSREWLGAEVTGVNSDRQGNLWVRTAGAGVVRIRDGAIQRLTTRDGLPASDLEGAFHDDGKGSLWFWDGPTHRLYRIRSGRHELVDLCYVDREGSTWIGTLASGLHRVREKTATLLAVNGDEHETHTCFARGQFGLACGRVVTIKVVDQAGGGPFPWCVLELFRPTGELITSVDNPVTCEIRAPPSMHLDCSLPESLRPETTTS